MRVAESILFAGKAVRVLRNPSPGFTQDTLHYHQIPRESYINQGFADRFSFPKDSSADSELTGKELLPQAEADKIEAMLQDLKVFFLSICFFIDVNASSGFYGGIYELFQ